MGDDGQAPLPVLWYGFERHGATLSASTRHDPGMDQRFGMTIPFDGLPLHAQRDWIVELADLGYTDVWSAEANGADAFTPLALASVWAPSLRLGTAIVPAFTRGPACMAQSVASLADAAPGRFAFGIGTSSNVIVEGWNGIPFESPYQRTKDMVRFLRAALAGEKVTMETPSFSIRSFKLGVRPEQPVPILIAALREGMLKLAGREGDGAIINWLGAEDVKTVAPIVHAAGDGSDKEIVARIFVAPNDDADTVRGMGRFAIAAYLNVPVYAAFHEWLGRGEVLGEMWRLWKEGDRKAALAAIPDEVVDDLIVWGSPERCREHIQRYVDNGVTTPALAILPFGVDTRQAIRDLAPRSTRSRSRARRGAAGCSVLPRPLLLTSMGRVRRPDVLGEPVVEGLEGAPAGHDAVLGDRLVEPGSGTVGPDADDAVLAEQVDAGVVGAVAAGRRLERAVRGHVGLGGPEVGRDPLERLAGPIGVDSSAVAGQLVAVEVVAPAADVQALR